jgi:hypothetical protein
MLHSYGLNNAAKVKQPHWDRVSHQQSRRPTAAAIRRVESSGTGSKANRAIPLVGRAHEDIIPRFSTADAAPLRKERAGLKSNAVPKSEMIARGKIRGARGSVGALGFCGACGTVPTSDSSRLTRKYWRSNRAAAWFLISLRATFSTIRRVQTPSRKPVKRGGQHRPIFRRLVENVHHLTSRRDN